MLELLDKDIFEDAMDAHIAKFYDSSEAADRLSKKVSTSSTFMKHIANSVKPKSGTAIAEKCSVLHL